MTIAKEIKVEYIGGDFSSRSVHELEGGVSYYNYEGTHFRVFETFNNAKAFLNGEPVKVIAEFDSEEELDRFLEEYARKGEDKAMRSFLEKQLGFSKESVSDIASGTVKLYAVHVVCDNELKHYSHHTKEEEAHASYLKLCKKWYSENGLEEFAKAVEYDSEIEHYDGYYNSEEYNDACDSAHVTWEVFNV